MKIGKLILGISLGTTAVHANAVDVLFTEINLENLNHYDTSTSVGNSGDVSLIDSNGNLFKWSLEEGLTSLPVSKKEKGVSLTKVSNDGSYILRTRSSSTADYFTPNGRINPNIEGFKSVDMSEDGLVIGGYVPHGQYSKYPAVYKNQEVVVFSDNQLLGYEIIDLNETGSVMLATSYDASRNGGNALALIHEDGTWEKLTNNFNPTGLHTLSSDGKFVFSRLKNPEGASCGHITNFKWSHETGLQEIDCQFSWVVDATEDASVIIGRGKASGQPWESYIWDKYNGTRNIRQVLLNHGVDLYGWSDIMVSDISDDGNKIVGVGLNPSGIRHPFVIDIVPVCNGF